MISIIIISNHFLLSYLFNVQSILHFKFCLYLNVQTFSYIFFSMCLVVAAAVAVVGLVVVVVVVAAAAAAIVVVFPFTGLYASGRENTASLLSFFHPF